MVFRKDVKKAVKKVYRGVKTVTGNRYGRGLRQIATKGIPQMASDIYKLKMLMNVEKKQREAAFSGYVGQVNINATGAYTQDITPLFSEGVGYQNRTGRSVKLTGCTIHSSVTEMSAQNIRINCNIYIIKIIGNPFSSGSTMLSEFLDVNPLTTIIDYNSDRNPQNFKQFKVLAKRKVTLYPEQMTTSGRNVGSKIHLKLNHHIKYNNDADGIVDGQIWAIMLTDSGNSNLATASTLVEIPVVAPNTGIAWRYFTRFYAVDN